MGHAFFVKLNIKNIKMKRMVKNIQIAHAM